MGSAELERLRKAHEELNERLEELHDIIEKFTDALQGSPDTDTVGVFKRLRYVEEQVIKCTQNVELQLKDYNIDITQKMELLMEKVQQNSTAITSESVKSAERLEEVIQWKKGITDKYDKVKEKFYSFFTFWNFWKIIVGIAGLITYDNAKEWGIWTWIKKIVNEFFKNE